MPKQERLSDKAKEDLETMIWRSLISLRDWRDGLEKDRNQERSRKRIIFLANQALDLVKPQGLMKKEKVASDSLDDLATSEFEKFSRLCAKEGSSYSIKLPLPLVDGSVTIKLPPIE
jgi:hypothetical protein